MSAANLSLKTLQVLNTWPSSIENVINLFHFGKKITYDDTVLAKDLYNQLKQQNKKMGVRKCDTLKGLSHQIFKSFLSSTILNQYFLYGRWWFLIFLLNGLY